MSESIKARMGQNKLGKMSNYALLKLLNATRADLASLYAVVNNVTTDANNLQIITNNLSSGLNNVKATTNNVVLALANFQTTVNNLVNDIVKVSNNQNAPNNTVQITATAVTMNVSAAVTNTNAVTLASGTAPVAQTLLA